MIEARDANGETPSEQRYARACERMSKSIELHAPQALIELNARLVLKAIAGGTWRALWSWARYEVGRWIGWHAQTVRILWTMVRHRCDWNAACDRVFGIADEP